MPLQIGEQMRLERREISVAFACLFFSTSHESPVTRHGPVHFSHPCLLPNGRIVAWDKGLAARLRMSVENRNSS